MKMSSLAVDNFPCSQLQIFHQNDNVYILVYSDSTQTATHMNHSCELFFGRLNTEYETPTFHYSDVIMSAMASQITGVSIVCSTDCWGADQRKHQSYASLAFMREIHRGPVNSPQNGPVTRKMFPLDDVIMYPLSVSSERGYRHDGKSSCSLVSLSGFWLCKSTR